MIVFTQIDEDLFTATGGLSPKKGKRNNRDRNGRDSGDDSELDDNRNRNGDRNGDRDRDRNQGRDQGRNQDLDLESGGGGGGNRDSQDNNINKDVNRPLITGDLLDATKVREKMRARTFVEVQFQENVICTTSMEGGAPLWKQSLSLPFIAPQEDYTPDSLSQVSQSSITIESR